MITPDTMPIGMLVDCRQLPCFLFQAPPRFLISENWCRTTEKTSHCAREEETKNCHLPDQQLAASRTKDTGHNF